jgi:hypothetical protein
LTALLRPLVSSGWSVGLLFCLFCLLLGGSAQAAGDATTGHTNFPLPLESYNDYALPGVGAKLLHRIQAEPFNLVATLIFFGAIVHTFLAGKFLRVARRYHDALHALETPTAADPAELAQLDRRRDRLQFKAQLFHFLGEVEAIFGIWGVPLAVAIIYFKGWSTMVHYIADTSFAEPVFVVVIMAIAASRPVLVFAEACLGKAAALGGGSPAAWWLAILTAGPLLGSFITEPAAMTICALLLGQRFYELNPSHGLRYATLGLLFVNISVGGTLTHFAAPPVVMVATTWKWDMSFMFLHFGWKAIVGIAAVNLVYFLRFRAELAGLKSTAADGATAPAPIPRRVTLIHLGFIAWTVIMSHYPPLVIIGFLFFLAFTEGTERHQHPINLRGPMLVGFFLSALIIHGGCQSWWIAPVLGSLTRWPLMIGSTLLTAVNDNAAIAYLASLVPGLSDSLKYAVLVGAVTGGGLTVIANAPNPAGQSLLNKYFGEEGISPLKLFLAALLPTIVLGAAFMLLP